MDFELFLAISQCQAESWALGSIVGLNQDFGHPGEAQEEGKVPPEAQASGAGRDGCRLRLALGERGTPGLG